MINFLSSYGIGKLEKRLDPNIFIRVHRSTIININYLDEIEKHFNGGLMVKMKSGKTFSVSRTYAKEIRKKGSLITFGAYRFITY